MKHLYFISGTMGVGKTAVCKILNNKLEQSVFLDGDWCWNMSPFTVNDETKNMVIENICFVLNNFLKCSQYKNIIFCWVMHTQNIIDDILSNLNLKECILHNISLICTKEELKKRLEKDIRCNIRKKDIIQKSIERLPLYSGLDTLKIDVSRFTPFQTAEYIINLSDKK